MKLWHKIVIALAIILLSIGGTLWWIPYHELGKGQLAILGYSYSNPIIPSIYLFNPLFRSWHHVPTDNLYPHYISWSPDGKKIAFTYSTSSADDGTITGIAILKLDNMQTQQVYIPPSNENLNVVTWSPDGQSLFFDVYENNALIAFQKLVISSGRLQSFPFHKNIGINHLEVAQNNDYVIGGSDGVYIASPDLESLRQVTPYMDGFFLTPDRKQIITPCAQSTICTYSIDTNQLTKTFPGTLPNHGTLSTGNWSYDEKDMVYLWQGAGENDPNYIMLVDIQNNQKFLIYKVQRWFGPDVVQLAWYTAK